MSGKVIRREGKKRRSAWPYPWNMSCTRQSAPCHEMQRQLAPLSPFSWGIVKGYFEGVNLVPQNYRIGGSNCRINCIGDKFNGLLIKNGKRSPMKCRTDNGTVAVRFGRNGGLSPRSSAARLHPRLADLLQRTRHKCPQTGFVCVYSVYNK
jgi:hypothetical protein